MEQSIIYVGLDVHKDTIAVALAEAGVGVIGASVFWRLATTFQGRRNGIYGPVRLEADGLGQEVGVFAQPIAGALDLDDDGVVKEPVEEGGGDDGIAEDVAPFGEAAV